MILEKEQIQRYLRHIIMPEISGPGQKKLLHTAVHLYSEDVGQATAMVYYLAASGIGHIVCSFEDTAGCNVLFENILDLNPDVKIQLTSSAALNETTDTTPTLRILLGKPQFILQQKDLLKNSHFVPTLLAACLPWMGMLQILQNEASLKAYIHMLEENIYQTISFDIHSRFIALGNTLSGCLLGSICAIEAIKTALNIGSFNTTLLFDLLSMDFLYEENLKMSEILQQAMIKAKDYFTRYSEKTDGASAADILADLKILIVGTGGLGSPAAFALGMAGVGTIGLVDFDQVELSNLNRQILHSTGRIDMPKVESAKTLLEKLYPNTFVKPYHTAFNTENAQKLISTYDLIIDGLDNLPTRYLLNDACHFGNKPFIEAGVLGFRGLATTIQSGESPCYRCLFTEEADNSKIPSCAETGVLGPVPGVMGFIEAAEAIKMIFQLGRPLKGLLLMYNSLDGDFSTVEIKKNRQCLLCGESPVITELGRYDFVCADK